eukprot:COSAG03_NODE_7902_length_858_cov_0.882740_1_plen_180_part_10
MADADGDPGSLKKKAKMTAQELETAKVARAEQRLKEEERRMEQRLAIIHEKERKHRAAMEARDYVEKVMEQRREADRARQAAENAARVKRFEEQLAAKEVRRGRPKGGRNDRKSTPSGGAVQFLPSSAYDAIPSGQRHTEIHSDTQGSPQVLGTQHAFRHAAPVLPPGGSVEPTDSQGWH